VVIHDQSLARTTGDTNYVFEKTYDEIRALDAGKRSCGEFVNKKAARR
jgi:glycerophosphoryl diester phosphodiesterase